MDDPLSRALDEAPEPHLQPAPDVVDVHTDHPRAVPDILDSVKEQALAAFALPFFDGDTASSSEPIIKVGLAEAGTVHISAQRLDPPYRADLMLYVRTDVESETDGHYEVRGRCELSRDVEAEPRKHHDFAVGVSVNDDGSVTLDVPQLRAQLIQAIRNFG
jgi:hypothetical protein